MTTGFVYKPNQVLYEVFITNSDLEQIQLVHQGFDRDIAESLMLKKFRQGEYKSDYMIYDHYSKEVLSLLFSEQSKRQRNEC